MQVITHGHVQHIPFFPPINQDPSPSKFESPNVQNQIFTLHLTNKCHQKEPKTKAMGHIQSL
jgi:hypothetical protein